MDKTYIAICKLENALPELNTKDFSTLCNDIANQLGSNYQEYMEIFSALLEWAGAYQEVEEEA